MINQRLTTAETAARLGVKPATVYAYVSRGLLHPERGPRGSTFDRHEVALLARSARHPGEGSPGRRTGREPGAGTAPAGGPAGEPIFVTELTLIAGGGLYYRGRHATDLAARWSFEQAAEWLWTGAEKPAGWSWAAPSDPGDRVAAAVAGLGPEVLPVERLMVATVAAALGDDLRHDLDPSRVPATGRRLLGVLAAALPLAGLPPGRPGHPGMAELSWRGLTRRRPAGADLAATGAALVLAADHELAPSTLAVRVAASFRADPYAVVLTGLGPSAGSWPAGSTGAPGEVEALLERAAETGAERAIGEHLRRSGQVPHGFGMPLYPGGDPRGRALLGRLSAVGDPARREVVRGVLRVGRERGFPPPNFDLGLGALSFCAEMVPGAGQALFTLGKVAGWLAHAMEEYARPTRFRIRADYAGAAPEVSSGS